MNKISYRLADFGLADFGLALEELLIGNFSKINHELIANLHRKLNSDNCCL